MKLGGRETIGTKRRRRKEEREEQNWRVGRRRRRFVILARPLQRPTLLVFGLSMDDAGPFSIDVEELTLMMKKVKKEVVLFRTKRGWWSCLLMMLQRT